VEEQPPHGRGGVDRLGVADEVDAERVELGQRGDERAERAGEAVVLPHQHAVEAPAPRVGHQRLELGRRPTAPARRIAADPVHVLAVDGEAADRGVLPQRQELCLRVLVTGGHARINRDAPGTGRHGLRLRGRARRAQYCRLEHAAKALRKPAENHGSDRAESAGFRDGFQNRGRIVGPSASG